MSKRTGERAKALQVHLTPEEREVIDRAAEAVGLAPSTYVRTTVLKFAKATVAAISTTT